LQAISPYSFGWRNVRGWLSETEAEELARLAKDKTVLEVGTFCGRSALAMAESARKVFCIDNFAGYSCESAHSRVRDEALGNFDRAGNNGKIVVLQGLQEDVLPQMNLSKIELVFYDADHSYEATARGIRLLQEAGLSPSATLVFHDYDEGQPGVVAAVNESFGPLGIKPKLVGSLAVFEGRAAQAQPAEDAACHKVMLGIPTQGQRLVYGAAQGLFRATWKHQVGIRTADSSLLGRAFNNIWCDALNRAQAGEITHLAFLHSDIAPCDGWIDLLIEEMEKAKASFCSAVSPIKDPRGLTSTGLGEPGVCWSPLRRFSMAEVLEFPETFSAESIGHPEKVLLLNSGCWVADLRNPAFFTLGEDDEARLFFTINDRVVCHEGKWVNQVESEDWFFSRRLHELGIPSVATRAVSLRHLGMVAFPNDAVWGSQKEDEELRPLWNPQMAD